MQSNFINCFYVFIALIRRDIRVMFHRWTDNVIDSIIIVGFWYLMYGCLLPSMGMNPDLITPIFFGIMMTVLTNVTYDRAIVDALDLDHIRAIDYQIALPIPINWLIAKYITSYVIDLFASLFFVLSFGRFIFGSALHFENGNFFLFTFIYLFCLVFISLFMFLIVMAKSFWWMRDNVWPRILLPLSLFGAFYYPWSSVVNTVPFIGYAYLFNPMIYMIEGQRSAATGSPGYIYWAWCLLALIIMMCAAIIFLKKAVKKRLDPLG